MKHVVCKAVAVGPAPKHEALPRDLLAALGAWLGWQMLLPIVLGASAIGALVGIIMKLNAKLREGRYVPFGPFLAGGGLVVLYAGAPRVLGWMGWA